MYSRYEKETISRLLRGLLPQFQTEGGVMLMLWFCSGNGLFRSWHLSFLALAWRPPAIEQNPRAEEPNTEPEASRCWVGKSGRWLYCDHRAVGARSSIQTVAAGDLVLRYWTTPHTPPTDPHPTEHAAGSRLSPVQASLVQPEGAGALPRVPPPLPGADGRGWLARAGLRGVGQASGVSLHLHLPRACAGHGELATIARGVKTIM